MPGGGSGSRVGRRDPEQFSGFGAEMRQFRIGGLVFIHPCDGLVVPRFCLRAAGPSCQRDIARKKKKSALSPPLRSDIDFSKSLMACLKSPRF